MIEQLTPFRTKYFAHELSMLHANNGIDRYSRSLFDVSVGKSKLRNLSDNRGARVHKSLIWFMKSQVSVMS